jgi:hypothetical protein
MSLVSGRWFDMLKCLTVIESVAAMLVGLQYNWTVSAVVASLKVNLKVKL